MNSTAQWLVEVKHERRTGLTVNSGGRPQVKGKISPHFMLELLVDFELRRCLDSDDVHGSLKKMSSDPFRGDLLT